MKRTIFLFTLLTSLFFAAGCGRKTVSLDAKALAEDLFQDITYEDELTLADDATAKKLYDIEQFVSAYVYISTGATSEEIAVFEFETEEEAKEAYAKADQRIADQKEDFTAYDPEEVKKLNNAVVKQEGTYLAVCVSGSSEAENIISDYFKQGRQ